MTQESDYTATGFANGVTWLLEAEAGDLSTFNVRTTAFSNSLPQIRVAMVAGATLIEQAGSGDGFVTTQAYQFPSSGVYKVTFFSNNTASPFFAASPARPWNPARTGR